MILLSYDCMIALLLYYHMIVLSYYPIIGSSYDPFGALSYYPSAALSDYCILLCTADWIITFVYYQIIAFPMIR